MHYIRITIGDNDQIYLEPAITLIESTLPIPNHYIDEEPDDGYFTTDPNKNHIPVLVKNYIQNPPLDYTKYFGSTDQNKILTRLLINRIKTTQDLDGKHNIGFIGELVLEDITPTM